MVKRWTVGLSHFPVVRRAPRVRPRIYPERILVMTTKITNKRASVKNKKEEKQQVMNCNTTLCCDVKTILHHDRQMRVNKDYRGTFRRDVECEEFRYAEHYTFTEALPQVAYRRYPTVYHGTYVNIHEHDDGTLHPSLRRVAVTKDFDIEGYARVVELELRTALKSLVKKGKK